MNLIVFIQLYYILYKPNIIFNKYLILIPYGIILILNGIRYNKINYDYLNRKYGQEDTKVRRRKGNVLLIYILLSLLLNITLIIWKANQ